jgi:hypothetical protein
MADILIWIFITLVALVAAVFLLAVYWQHRIKETLKGVFGTIRQAQQFAGQKRAERAGYSPEDPEPYGSLAEKLQRQLDIVDSAVNELMRRYGELQTAYRTVSLWTWKTLPSFPLDIYALHKQVAQLKMDTQETVGSLQAVDRFKEELDQQGLKVAGEVRQTLEQDLKAGCILGDLQSAGVQDPLLEKTIEDIQNWERILRNQAPAYFMGGDEAAIKNQADKHTVAQVFRVVDQARPAVDEMLKKAQDWQQQHDDLERVLRKLPDGLRQLSDDVDDLENGTIHPVTWDQTRGPLTGLRSQIERIGEIKKKRTLEQIVSECASAEKLNTKMQELTTHAAEIKQAHEEFIKIMEMPDIARGVAWTRNAQRLAVQTNNYPPDNWPAEHGVGSLQNELKALDESHQRLTWDSPAAPVRETELPALLEEARKLEKLHTSLRPRAASIQARLSQMQADERETRNSLNSAKALLNQATPLLSANPLLTPNAVMEAEQLRAEVDPLAAEVEAPGTGLVDKKKQKAQVFLRKADQMGAKWLEILLNDLDTKKDSLAKRVENLNSIALLEEPVVEEADKLVEDVKPRRETIPAGGSSGAGEAAKKPGDEKGILGIFRRRSKEETVPSGQKRSLEGISLADAISQLKQKNEEWQHCVSLARAMDDIEKPIMERYAKAIEQREATRQLTAKAIELIPDGRGWPPNQQNMVCERQQLIQLEKRWEALHQNPSKAIQVVSTLGALSEEYQALGSRERQLVERAQQEQTRFVDMESRLEESKHLWNQTLQEQEGNRTIQDAIRDMLAGIDTERSSIQKNYQNDSISYNQALQDLRGLSLKVDGMLIPLDNLWDVDINGNKVAKGSGQ